ncbi:Rrf2 family transcriptional regulator [Cyanobium sp. WAJ14-Wanaka]|uniref:RrF2 family transcriptional regulator n=1 Tax=Cyanobium sp. WAJ14-Wanaka TaxID=2823725 RepID=UPI0020CE8564|nr:Rrf2 family transcriptional regulator [Cyanobium sp. WAJ14-Wanaka]MCP9774673.1 Rrf2 family transcriptional regulator [Cyanobium sp. WAJ14-Wanaka]
MLSKAGAQAVKALIELAASPQQWRSTADLARAQQLPEPMLEQVLLKLRRSGLLQARRGRLGGYRLARPAQQISIGLVLGAVARQAEPLNPADASEISAADQVTSSLERHLVMAQQRALAELTVEDLYFDLRSALASRQEDGGLLLG